MKKERVIKWVPAAQVADGVYDHTVGLQYLIDTYGAEILGQLHEGVYAISKTLRVDERPPVWVRWIDAQ